MQEQADRRVRAVVVAQLDRAAVSAEHGLGKVDTAVGLRRCLTIAQRALHAFGSVVALELHPYRIDLAHLCWSLENLAGGNPVNVIKVDEETAKWSLVALERMLEVR